MTKRYDLRDKISRRTLTVRCACYVEDIKFQTRLKMRRKS